MKKTMATMMAMGLAMVLMLTSVCLVVNAYAYDQTPQTQEALMKDIGLTVYYTAKYYSTHPKMDPDDIHFWKKLTSVLYNDGDIVKYYITHGEKKDAIKYLTTQIRGIESYEIYQFRHGQVTPAYVMAYPAQYVQYLIMKVLY